MKGELADYLGITKDTNPEERIDAKVYSLKTEILDEIVDGKWHVHFLTGYDDNKIVEIALGDYFIISMNAHISCIK